MAINYGQLQEKVLRTLSDIAQKQHSEELVYDAVCGAHDAILPWVPYSQVAALSSGSNGVVDLDLFAIPPDCYQADAVQLIDTGTFIPKTVFAPNTVRNTGQETIIDWVEFPTGYISVSDDLPAGEQIRLYYRAFWPKPASTSDTAFQIVVPSYAHLGMVYYAAAHCLLPRSVGSGGIRQFNDKSDSGTPEDNPLYNMSNWFLQRFAQEMKLMPPYTKVGF